MSPVVHASELDTFAQALSSAGDRLRSAAEKVLGPIVRGIAELVARVRRHLFPETGTPHPRFIAYTRNARTVILHDRKTDRLLPLPSGDEYEVARLLVVHPGAFWSTESARAEVRLAIVQGRGVAILEEYVL